MRKPGLRPFGPRPLLLADDAERVGPRCRLWDVTERVRVVDPPTDHREVRGRGTGQRRATNAHDDDLSVHGERRVGEAVADEALILGHERRRTGHERLVRNHEEQEAARARHGVQRRATRSPAARRPAVGRRAG